MIFGDLPDPISSKQIDSTISDLADVYDILLKQQRRNRCPHSRKLRVLCRLSIDLLTAEIDPLIQQLASRPPPILPAVFLNSLDRKSAGNLASAVASHTISDNVETELIVLQEGILIDL